MRTSWLLTGLVALTAWATTASAHSYGSSCQTSNDSGAANCHAPSDFTATVQLTAAYYCGSSNQLNINVNFPWTGYGHWAYSGYYVKSVLVEYSDGLTWRTVTFASHTYSSTYYQTVPAPGSYQARVTVTTQEGSASAVSSWLSVRACTAADYAPRNIQTTTTHWWTCGYRTTMASSWDSPARSKSVTSSGFSHYEVIPYQNGIPGSPQYVGGYSYTSPFLTSPPAGSSSYRVQVTAVMSNGERSVPATGNTVMQRLCRPTEIDFRATVWASSYQPCGGSFHTYISYSAPSVVRDTYKTAWQSWTLERRIQGAPIWTMLASLTGRNNGFYDDDANRANGPRLGITYEYRVTYNGQEGSFPSNSVTSRLEDCPTASMTSVRMVAVCPPRNEVKWSLQPQAKDTKQAPSGVRIQRSQNGWTWTTLNPYYSGGIVHQAIRDTGTSHEWWNYDIWGATQYWYRIQYTFAGKGTTTSPAMAADAVVKKCDAPRLLNVVGTDAQNRGMGGQDGSIEFDATWVFLDSRTPASTLTSWLNDGTNYYSVLRCAKHPPGAQGQLQSYSSTGHSPMACTPQNVVRSDLKASPTVNLNHVKDANVWGNVSYTYQAFINTKTDDHYSNTASTWIRGEPWPVAKVRIETFPYLNSDPAARRNPPGDYPPELAVTPRAPGYGFAEITIQTGNNGAGGAIQEVEVTFRYRGSATDFVVCRFTPAQYQALAMQNAKITWRARGPLNGLVYPKDFTQPGCNGTPRDLTEGTVGHVVLVRSRNPSGWSNALQIDGLKAWSLTLGQETTSHSDPGNAGSPSPTRFRAKTLSRIDKVTHDVAVAQNTPAPLSPPGYVPRYPGQTGAQVFLRNAENVTQWTVNGQPCQGPLVHQLYLNQERGAELYGAKGKRLYGFEPAYSKARLWFFAGQVDFNTTTNPIPWDARAPMRYYEFLANSTWMAHSNGLLAYVNQDTPRAEDFWITNPDDDQYWITGDAKSYPHWRAFFTDDGAIPSQPGHSNFPDIEQFRLPFNGIGKFCFLDNLTADGEIQEFSRTCSFLFINCGTSGTGWQAGNPRYLASRVDVGTTTTTFQHMVLGATFNEQAEYYGSLMDQKPRTPHTGSDACKCYRQSYQRTPEEHRLTQAFSSAYNLYEELQSRGNGRPAAGTEAMFFDDQDRPEDPPVDAQFRQQLDSWLPEPIKEELARRNLEGAAVVRPPNATAGEPETPVDPYYFSNQAPQAGGYRVHPYLGHVWAELVPDRSVWWDGGYLVDGSFRPVLWIGATASPLVDWMRARNITMDDPHVRWTYTLEPNATSPWRNYVGPRPTQLLVEGDGWQFTAPTLNLTRAFFADTTARMQVFVDFGWKTRERGQVIHQLNITTSMPVIVHQPTLTNTSLADYGVPVLKHDKDPRGASVVRAFWHSYPQTAAPWVTYDWASRTYQGTPQALLFGSGFSNHYQYRDPDPTPTGAWGSAEVAINTTNPATPPHPDDQRRLTATDVFLHLALMPRNTVLTDGKLRLAWTLFDPNHAGTATSPSPEDTRFNVVRNSTGSRIVSYGWLNDAPRLGQPAGSFVPVEGTMTLQYLIRVTPTLDWDAGAQATRLDSNACRHGRWSLQVTYTDGSTATAGPVDQPRCMTSAWRSESIPLTAGKGIKSIQLVGLPYVSTSWSCSNWTCGSRPDAIGRNMVHNVYLDAIQIRKQVGQDVSFLHLWDAYQATLPLFEETGFRVDQFFVDADKMPLSPRTPEERLEMVTPGDPFLVFNKVPDLPGPGVTPFLHPYLIQGVMLGELEDRITYGAVENALAQQVRESELEAAQNYGWTDAANLPSKWYKDATDQGLARHLRGPWTPAATNAYLRYWSHLRGDADKDESRSLVPDSDANPAEPGQATPNDRFLPSFSSSFATEIVHTTNENPEGPSFYKYGWSQPGGLDAVRDYYLGFQDAGDAAFVRNFEGTLTYLTTIPAAELPETGLAANPIWPFHDPQPTNITLGGGYNLTVGSLVAWNATVTRAALEDRVARAAMENATPSRRVGHIEIHPLPVHLDGCWRYLTANNGTAINPTSPLARWQNMDALHNVTSNITKSIQVRVYATVHRGTPGDLGNVSRDICVAPNRHVVPIAESLDVAFLYRQAATPIGATSTPDGTDRLKIGRIDLQAPYNATGSYLEFTFNATGVPTFHALYDSWETYLASDVLVIGQFTGPPPPAGQFNSGSLLAIIVLALLAPFFIHKVYGATRRFLGGL